MKKILALVLAVVMIFAFAACGKKATIEEPAGDVTLDVAMDALKDYGEKGEKKITPDSIIEACAKFYNVRKEDIYSEKRTKEIAFARQVSMYIMREVLDYSFPKIGAVFGKDHATAIYGHKSIAKAMNESLGISFNIEGLINDIKGENN